VKIEVVLITGRTIKQGIGLGRGKNSDLYREETGTIEVHSSVLERLGVKEGDLVQVKTSFGEAIFSCRRGEVPEKVAFIPYGLAANRLIGAGTGGSGMPGFKGIPVVVGRYQDD
jgi:formylmethanofuran dehydrogenase subunit D